MSTQKKSCLPLKDVWNLRKPSPDLLQATQEIRGYGRACWRDRPAQRDRDRQDAWRGQHRHRAGHDHAGLAPLIGVRLTTLLVVRVIGIELLMAVALAAFGVFVAGHIRRMEGFSVVM